MDSLPAEKVGGELSSPPWNSPLSGHSRGQQRIIIFFLKPNEVFQDRLTAFKKENGIPRSTLGSWVEVVDPTRNLSDGAIFAWCRSDLLRGTGRLLLFGDRKEYLKHTQVRGKKIKIVLRFGYTGYETPADDFDILLEESTKLI